ncbi:MAG: TraR/DksA C4-type zinc finger protein [Bryobacterales bacterium]|nr:TraR/DksA C4-type zinc finger protein [Bryobacterales bacterium]
MIVEQFAQFGPALETLAVELRSRLSAEDAPGQEGGHGADTHIRSGARLELVENAIRRLECGEYGYCARCEDEISYARLKARPESHLCGRCGAGKS